MTYEPVSWKHGKQSDAYIRSCRHQCYRGQWCSAVYTWCTL